MTSALSTPRVGRSQSVSHRGRRRCSLPDASALDSSRSSSSMSSTVRPRINTTPATHVQTKLYDLKETNRYPSPRRHRQRSNTLPDIFNPGRFGNKNSEDESDETKSLPPEVGGGKTQRILGNVEGTISNVTGCDENQNLDGNDTLVSEFRHRSNSYLDRIPNRLSMSLRANPQGPQSSVNRRRHSMDQTGQSTENWRNTLNYLMNSLPSKREAWREIKRKTCEVDALARGSLPKGSDTFNIIMNDLQDDSSSTTAPKTNADHFDQNESKKAGILVSPVPSQPITPRRRVRWSDQSD